MLHAPGEGFGEVLVFNGHWFSHRAHLWVTRDEVKVSGGCNFSR